MIRAAAFLLLVACGRSGTAAPPDIPEESPMSDCTVRVQAGDDIARHLSDGAVICLGPGVHEGGLDISASVTLRGEPGAVLDGRSRGSVVRIGADRLSVRIENLTITRGAFAFGSGILVEGYSEVSVVGCTVDGNASGEGKAAGLGARRGWVTVQDTTFGEDDDVIVTTTAEATFVGSTVPSLTALEKAQVVLKGGKVGFLAVRGTTTRAPTVTIAGAEVATLANDETLPGTVVRQ